MVLSMDIALLYRHPTRNYGEPPRPNKFHPDELIQRDEISWWEARLDTSFSSERTLENRGQQRRHTFFVLAVAPFFTAMPENKNGNVSMQLMLHEQKRRSGYSWPGKNKVP